MKNIKIHRKKNYAIVQLNRGKVNAINRSMVEELRQAFQELEADETVGGVIFTGIPHFFSAGLDLIELYEYDKQVMHDFLIEFSGFHVQLARFTKPLICAINGHCPAGGTVWAIAADYRIMVEGEKYKLGLNEIAVNVQVSQNIVEAYAFWIGRNLAHRYLLDGKLLTGKEALACNLVDELVAAEDLLPRAEAKMQQYLQAHPMIFRNTKFKARRSWLEKINLHGEEDLAQAQEVWWDPRVRTRMKMFVASLTKNRK